MQAAVAWFGDNKRSMIHSQPASAAKSGSPLAKTRFPKKVWKPPRNSRNYLCLRSFSGSLLPTECGLHSTKGHTELSPVWLPFHLISNYSLSSTHALSLQSGGNSYDHFSPSHCPFSSSRSALSPFKAEFKFHTRLSEELGHSVSILPCTYSLSEHLSYCYIYLLTYFPGRLRGCTEIMVNSPFFLRTEHTGSI